MAAIVAAPPREDDRRRRRVLFAIIGVLGALLILLTWLSLRYVLTREPLPIPQIIVPTGLPHYVRAIYGVDAPVGVAVSPDGSRIYVTEAAQGHSLKVFDGGGTLLAAAAPPDSDAANRVPVFVARDPLTGEVYVTDRLTRKVHIYGADGTYQRELTPPPDALDWAPLGIGFGPDGTLLVTDVSTDPHRILVLDRAGSVVRTITSRTGLSYPLGVVVAGGDVYAADGNNAQLVRALGDGTAAVPVIGPGMGAGDLALPRGVATDSRDRIYVVDNAAHAVMIYDLPDERGERPTFAGSLGVQGRLDGQFQYPNGIAADAQGRIYVADQVNNRLQIWSY